MTDQQRHDQLGYSSGGLVRTPNLDRLAAGGVVFESAYSASTTCVPARTSLLTGLLDHRTRYAEPLALEPGFFTVPHALQAVGYQTALIGKMHFTPMRADHGFEHVRLCEHTNAYRQAPAEMAQLDHYHDFLAERGLADWRFEGPGLDGPVYPYDPATHPTSWVRDETLAFLAGRDPDRPLFLVVSFPHPHPPVNPPEPYASLYDPSACVVDPDGASRNDLLPATYRRATAQADAPQRRVDPRHLDAHRAELARTYGLITQIDDAVGEIVGRLDLADALLFFTSDHGDYGGRRGLVRKIPWIPFDDLARVPCFATGGLVAGGRRLAEPMQSFDFPVTCLDLSGAAEALGVDLGVFDGISLRPVLSDADGSLAPDRLVFSAVSQQWPMVRRGPHKYIRELGWGEEVLFDVARDPDETLDLKALDPDRTLLDDFAAAVDRQLAATVPDLPSFRPGG